MVEVEESSMVVPSTGTPSHTIWLSNMDIFKPRVHTPTVYFYRPNGDADFFSAEPLRAALGDALVPFYPMAGRLGVDGAGRAQIECTGEGVLLVVARSELSMDDFGDFSPSDAMRKMLVPAAETGEPPCMLAMFQVTFFKCGGVCLGAAVHHTAFDGLSALHFINSWSDIARGGAVPQIAVPPSLDRSLLRARAPPIVTFDHPVYAPNPPSTTATANRSSLIAANLSLSGSQIRHLKNTNPNKPISTFKAVVAHIWRTACKARSLHPKERTRLLMSADARSPLQPPLPAGYLGNAVFRVPAVAAAGDITSNTLGFAADEIGQATAGLGDEYVRSLIDYLETLDVARGHEGNWVMQRSDVMVVNWQGLPMYDADFGWGRPVFMGKASQPFPGVFHVMPDGGESGGIRVTVGLESESMDEFKRLFYEDLAVFC